MVANYENIFCILHQVYVLMCPMCIQNFRPQIRSVSDPYCGMGGLFYLMIPDGQLGSQVLADIGAMLSDPAALIAWS